MGDVSELLKRHFTMLHKGTNVAQTIDDRKEVHNNARKEKRDTLALLRRNIVGNMSPITPTPMKNIKKDKGKVDTTTKELPEKNRSFITTGCSKRLELLQKWKAEKTKKKEQEKAKAKPIFKVCHVTSTTYSSDIEDANKFVKGKPVVPNSATKKSKFAPENHQFRPPSGIRPINLTTAANTSVSKRATPLVRTNISVSKKVTPLLRTKIDLRSRKTKADTPSSSKGKTSNLENNAKKTTTNTSKSTREGPSAPTKKTTESKPLIWTKNATKDAEKAGTSKNATDKTPTHNVTRRNKVNITANTSNKTELNGIGALRKTPQNPKVTVKGNKVVEKGNTSRILNTNTKSIDKARNYVKSSTSSSNTSVKGKEKNPKVLNKSHKSIDVAKKDVTDSKRQVHSRNSSASSSNNSVNGKEKNPRVLNKNNKSIDIPEPKQSDCENFNKNKSSSTELNGRGTLKKTPQCLKVAVKGNKVVKKEVNSRILNRSHKSIDDAKKDVTDSNTQVQLRKSSPSSSNNFVNGKEPEILCGDETVHNEIASTNTPHSLPSKQSDCENSNKNKSSLRNTPSSANGSNKLIQKLKENLLDLTSPAKKSVLQSKNSSSSTDYSIDYNNFTSPEVSAFKTPPPVYLSPFVTISRGKQSARKEYKIRASQGKCEIEDPSLDLSKILTANTSPQAGAAYFKRKLDSEVVRIEAMCDEWQALLENPTVPEEAHPSIGVTIGQSRLLVTKKFEQFRGLIRQCETKNYELKPITCDDLHGFWDMLRIQTEDLDKRFDELRKLRDNNWEEMLEVKSVVAVKRTRGRPKKVQTKSKIKQMIEEARRKQKEQSSGGSTSSSVFTDETSTPVKERLLDIPTSSTRKSLRESLLSRERKSRCSSSPGLTMMRVSQSIKRGDGLTPARSILKMDAVKSTGKKSVVFKEDLETSKVLSQVKLFGDDEKENVSENLLVKDDHVLTPRRSSRLTKLKI